MTTQRIHLDSRDPDVQRLLRAAFPAYKGHKVCARVEEAVTLIGTYWDGGSRSTYVAVSYRTGQRVDIPKWAPPQFGGPSQPPIFRLEPDVVLLEHAIFCGKDAGITVYVHPDNAPRLLPRPVELSDPERQVLRVMHDIIAGPYRYEELARVGISRESYEVICAALAERKLLTRGKALTVPGRNAMEQH